jgi:hypothetical protein
MLKITCSVTPQEYAVSHCFKLPGVGIEPTTNGLTEATRSPMFQCSAAELDLRIAQWPAIGDLREVPAVSLRPGRTRRRPAHRREGAG